MSVQVSEPNAREKREYSNTTTCPSDNSATDIPVDINEKKLLRKIDWRLLPILGALYSISLIDRTNVSNARVAGMDADLALSVGNRYTTVIVLFFPTYALLELPSNLILRKVGSANWLALIAFGWGIVMVSQAFVKSWVPLAVCRLLLGACEAGFFPGCVYLITCWYVRYETQRRLGGFFLLSVGIGGIANILAYGLMQMEGIAGLRGWQWIFILEGAATCVIAMIAWFIILDFPDKAEARGFLTHAEATFVLRRIDDDRGDSMADHLTFAKLARHLGDFKLWAFATMFMASATPAYAFAYFLPVILVGMGYSPGIANALSAPPAIFSVVFAFGFAWLADKYHVRGPIIATQALLTVTGLMLVAYLDNHGARYFGVCLGIMGGQSNVLTLLAYQSNNIRGQSKRAVATALQVGFGAVGGTIASTTFKQSDAPKYITGLWVAAGLQGYILLVLSCTTAVFWRSNKRIDRQIRAGGPVDTVEGQVGFKYTL